MEHRKTMWLDHRPFDYLKERNCKSTIQTRRSYGTSLIGWEATRLNDKLQHNRANSTTLQFLDKMRNNHSRVLSEKFTKMIDKQLFMKRGFPFHKLDMRKQRHLVKEVDILSNKLKYYNKTSKK